jgi:hypothetical protein
MSEYPIAVVVGSLRRDSFDGLFDASDNIGAESKKFLTDWMNRYVAWVKKYSL